MDSNEGFTFITVYINTHILSKSPSDLDDDSSEAIERLTSNSTEEIVTDLTMVIDWFAQISNRDDRDFKLSDVIALAVSCVSEWPYGDFYNHDGTERFESNLEVDKSFQRISDSLRTSADDNHRYVVSDGMAEMLQCFLGVVVFAMIEGWTLEQMLALAEKDLVHFREF
jgi:hypothetical protein